VLVGSVCLVALLGMATAAGPWRTSLSRTRVGSLFFSPPPPLPPLRTADAVGNLSAPSGIDAATAITFTDNPLTVGTTLVKAVHMTELRQAVNAVRATANLGAATWTDPTLSTSVTIKAVHVTELRTNLDAALSALSITPSAYTDPSLTEY
jgi:hypothetical protein